MVAQSFFWKPKNIEDVVVVQIPWSESRRADSTGFIQSKSVHEELVWGQEKIKVSAFAIREQILSCFVLCSIQASYKLDEAGPH